MHELPPNVTRRDWFAAQAMQGLLQGMQLPEIDPQRARTIAEVSYAHADAMLAVRYEAVETAPSSAFHEAATAEAQVEPAPSLLVLVDGRIRELLGDARLALRTVELEVLTRLRDAVV